MVYGALVITLRNGYAGKSWRKLCFDVKWLGFFLNFILNGSMQCAIVLQNREHIHYLNVLREFIVMYKKNLIKIMPVYSSRCFWIMSMNTYLIDSDMITIICFNKRYHFKHTKKWVIGRCTWIYPFFIK